MDNRPQIDSILDFWFTEPMRNHWFRSSPDIDQLIRERFEPLWEPAKTGQLDSWKKQLRGCLALIILMDQFPRNMFRGQAEAYAMEKQAIDIAQYAISEGLVERASSEHRIFLLLPMMHSEDLHDQEQSVHLFTQYKMEKNVRFAVQHRDIIARFGRFPHRNRALGRKNTVEDEQYLASDEAFTG